MELNDKDIQLGDDVIDNLYKRAQAAIRGDTSMKQPFVLGVLRFRAQGVQWVLLLLLLQLHQLDLQLPAQHLHNSFQLQEEVTLCKNHLLLAVLTM